MDVLLIHPPATKPSEPPLGAAVLLHHLRQAGLQAEVLDANLGAYLYLLDPRRLRAAAGPGVPTPLRRALRHAEEALAFLRSPAAGRSFARYATAVSHLERALAVWGAPGERLTLGDYRHHRFSEFAPDDLERAAGGAATLFAGYFEAEVLPRVAARPPRMVGISVNYRHQVLPAFELAGMLRRRFPGITVVGGGGVFSGWAPALRRSGLRFAPFDRLVFGPGEAPLAALARGKATAEYGLEDPAAVGFRPDFSFAPLGDYLSPVRILPLAASRGCYWRRCRFCPEAAAPFHPYRGLPPAEVLRLLADLAACGADHVHFTDDALPPAVLAALAGRPRGAPGWHGFARFEGELQDPEFVRRLAAGGCRMLQLGLESGSQAVLDRLCKGTRVEQAAAVLAALRQAGVSTYVYALLGTPGETAGEAEATRAFLEGQAAQIDFLNLAIMNLPRNEEDDAAAGDLLGFYRDFVPEPGWDRRAVRRFLRERMLATPGIRAAVHRIPPAFTSNHAFLFGASGSTEAGAHGMVRPTTSAG